MSKELKSALDVDEFEDVREGSFERPVTVAKPHPGNQVRSINQNDDAMAVADLKKPFFINVSLMLGLFFGGAVALILVAGFIREESLGFWNVLVVIFCAFLSWAGLSAGVEEYKRKKADYDLAQKDYKLYVAKKAAEESAKEKLREDMILKKNQEEEAQKKQREQLEKTVAANKAKGIACCPRCASTSIATINRGYSAVWGALGSGQPVNVCQMCGYKFKPGS